MRWIYLSPHLDDAALSAGGLIYDQVQSGIPVEIWTLMSGYAPESDVSPFAQMLHLEWGFSSAEETTRRRREEDQAAASILGAKTVHFDFLDCIYRRAADGQWLYSHVFEPPHPEDVGLPLRMATTIAARLEPDDVLVCQLSIGSHVDHILVRQAVELLAVPVRYDMDMPYILYHPDELPTKSAGMSEFVYRITKKGLASWQEAALAYKSQIEGLGEAFDTPAKMLESIQAYWEERKGICLLQTES